jgi:hypothetical protein
MPVTEVAYASDPREIIQIMRGRHGERGEKIREIF